MKPVFAATLFSALAVGMSQAGPAEKAIVAAMKLSEQPNYSWTSSVDDDARSYHVEGKTAKGGCTWMRLPMVKSLAQRLGRDADTEIEAVFRGSSVCVLRTNRGWQSLKELPKRAHDWNDDVDYWPMPVAPAPGGYWGRGSIMPHDPMDPFPMALQTIPMLPPEEESRPYSNAQFALSHPHDELALIVSSYVDLKVEGDVVTGTLSDIGAQLLLVREGQNHINPVAAAGVFKLLLKGGLVVRYYLKLEGILIIDRKRIHVHQASSTTLRDIGTTSFQVPEEAQRKLERLR
jgi:hypothetical protein